MSSCQQFGTMFKIRFRTGPKGKAVTNYFAEVDPILRRLLLRKGRVFVGFRALTVRDYLVVSSCVNCQDLGHVSKYCHSKEEVCGHCEKAGHRRAECPDKIKPAVCIPCLKRGKKCANVRGQCQTYKIMVDRLAEKTDYGN